MAEVWRLFADHAFWAWMGLAALLLAVEVLLGSGYLLWPAAAAGVVALLVLTRLSPGLPAELALFALLTIASSLLARRFFRGHGAGGPDINDLQERLIGRRGLAVGAFSGGRGRVFVEGKEWSAHTEDDLAAGDDIEVARVLDGAALLVRRASV